MNLLVSTLAMVFGAFAAASPYRAAAIFSSQRLGSLAPERRALFVRWYRAFGILLCLAGFFHAIDTIVLPHYHR
jgi:hypothetical protein